MVKKFFLLSLLTALLIGCGATATQRRISEIDEMTSQINTDVNDCHIAVTNQYPTITTNLMRAGLMEPWTVDLESMTLDWYFPEAARDDYIMVTLERNKCDEEWQRSLIALYAPYSDAAFQYNNEVFQIRVSLLNNEINVGQANTQMKESLDRMGRSFVAIHERHNRELQRDVQQELNVRAARWQAFAQGLSDWAAQMQQLERSSMSYGQSNMPVTTRCRTSGQYTTCNSW